MQAKRRLLVDIVLENAKILSYGGVTQAAVAIDDGKIAKISKKTNMPPASRKMNLEGLLILPGLIDAHVHLRDQELGYKEDFSSGTAAAANGGVTLVIDMPNNKPVTMDQSTLRERIAVAEQKSVINVAFYSAFPEKIDEMQSIIQEGAKGFKLYMSEKIGGQDPDDDEALLRVSKEAAKSDIPISIHAEDRKLLQAALKRMKGKGNDSIDSYLKVHSPEVEVRAIERAIEIAKMSGARIHICHVSTDRGLETICAAKTSGLPVTCEVAPHHLLLSSHHLKDIGPVALTNPPMRSRRSIRSLWSRLLADFIDILVSDHAPHARNEKTRLSIWETAAGIAGIETLLPLMLTQVSRKHLPLALLVKMMSENPAGIFRLEGRGGLSEGNCADLVVVDMKREWEIDASKFYSKANFSPFDGWQVKGKPVKTFVNGSLVMDEGEIVAKPGEGMVIR